MCFLCWILLLFGHFCRLSWHGLLLPVRVLNDHYIQYVYMFGKCMEQLLSNCRFIILHPSSEKAPFSKNKCCVFGSTQKPSCCWYVELKQRFPGTVKQIYRRLRPTMCLDKAADTTCADVLRELCNISPRFWYFAYHINHIDRTYCTYTILQKHCIPLFSFGIIHSVCFVEWRHAIVLVMHVTLAFSLFRGDHWE